MARHTFQFGDEFVLIGGDPNVRYTVLRAVKDGGRTLIVSIRVGDPRGKEMHFWDEQCDPVNKILDSLITW